MVAHALRTQILYQKSGLLTEISRRDFSAVGLSGLSLPDAPCEHTAIRATAANLTREVERLKSTCGRCRGRFFRRCGMGEIALPHRIATAFQQKDELTPSPHNPRARHRQTVSAAESRCEEEPVRLRSDDAAPVPNCAVCRR